MKTQRVLIILKNQLDTLQKRGVALRKEFTEENIKDPASRKTSMLATKIEQLKFAIRDLDHAIHNLEMFNND